MSKDDSLLSMWTVYDHPRDYPEGYIARRWDIGKNTSLPTADVIRAKNLRTIRDKMTNMGLVKLMRSDGDDPTIVESWI